jgi:hypothetical protein
MPRTIISKVKVLEVYPDAECWSHNNGLGCISYYIIKATKKTKHQSSQAKAWGYCWQIIRAEQRKKQGNAPKEITTVRIKPTVKANIIKKHGSVQKWVDSMTTAI